MEKRAKAIIVIIMGVLLIVLAYRYKSYLIDRSYTLFVNTTCDQSQGQCFLQDCDPTVDEECDDTPYKKVEITASEAPECLLEHTCEEFNCNAAGTDSCQITYCSEDSIEEGERCLEGETVL